MTASESSAVTARFRELISRPDDRIDLAEAAFLIAKHLDASLDLSACLARIDAMAERLSQRLTGTSSDTDRIVALNQFLFDEEGFAGNAEDYYDPRNSFLDQVLERRLGIPITLSILYMELGERIGLELRGIAFPGHFLVKCRVNGGVVVLDPFSRGISLGLPELQQRLRATQGGEVSRAIIAGLLVAASRRDIVTRMLRNLKAIYVQRDEHERALSVMEWIVMLAPEVAIEVRDRGLLYAKLECPRAAAQDIERYLDLAPEAEDATELRKRAIELRKAAARLN